MRMFDINNPYNTSDIQAHFKSMKKTIQKLYFCVICCSVCTFFYESMPATITSLPSGFYLVLTLVSVFSLHFAQSKLKREDYISDSDFDQLCSDAIDLKIHDVCKYLKSVIHQERSLLKKEHLVISALICKAESDYYEYHRNQSLIATANKLDLASNEEDATRD